MILDRKSSFGKSQTASCPLAAPPVCWQPAVGIRLAVVLLANQPGGRLGMLVWRRLWVFIFCALALAADP